MSDVPDTLLRAMKTIGILVFDEVEELDFVGPLEVFGMAARFGADCETLVIAPQPGHVRCRHGLQVLPDCSLQEAPALDLLIVPGGLGARTHAKANPQILEFVRRQRGTVVSVCTGALILAAAGILDGFSATTHQSSLDLLREYGQITIQEGARFVMHERVATSAGVTAGIDLALALVAREWGHSVAETVAANLEWESTRWKQPQSDKILAHRRFSIRRATMDDSDGILSCLLAAFKRYESSYTSDAFEDTVLTAESLQKRLGLMSILVAISAGGEIVGTIAYHTVSPDEGHLRGMAVRPEWQGTGMAPALLQAAETELRKKQCKRITLDTTDSLRRAVRFYEKRGFIKSGRESDLFGMRLYEYVKPL